MPQRTLSQDEHYIADVATKQDGVPQSITNDLAIPLPSQSNLPTDYDSSRQPTQLGHDAQDTWTKQPVRSTADNW